MLAIQKKLTNSFYALLSLPATGMGFALSIQISALSWILSTQYNLKIDEVGLVWAAGPLAGILGQVIIGVISDKVWIWGGRRRPFILIGGVFAALMLLALPNIGTITSTFGFKGVLGVAIAVALTLDLAINVSFNPTRSIIADVTPEGTERTKGYTWMQTVSGTFGVLAYVIGAVWNNYVLIYSGIFMVLLLAIIPVFFIEEPKELTGADEIKHEKAPSTSFIDILLLIEPLWGFLLYAIYAITAKVADYHPGNYIAEIICFAVTIVFILKTLLEKSSGNDPIKQGILAYKKILAAHSFTWIGIQTMFVYMFAYVQFRVFGLADGTSIPEQTKIEMGRIVTISFLIFNAIAAVLPAFALEPLARILGRVKTHLYCIASMAVGYAFMLISGDSALSIYIIMAVLGIGWASTISLPFAIMSQEIDQSRMGLFMGLFNLSVVLPQLVASFGVGQAVSAAADKSVIFYIATFCLGFSALLWALIKERKQAEKYTAAGKTGH